MLMIFLTIFFCSNDLCFWAFLSNLRSSSVNSSDSDDLPMIPSVLIERLTNDNNINNNINNNNNNNNNYGKIRIILIRIIK